MTTSEPVETRSERLSQEQDRVRVAYARRDSDKQRYSIFAKNVIQIVQKRERTLLAMLNKTLRGPMHEKRILDIGCGRGGTLVPMLQYGFMAENCYGIDILEDRIEQARAKCPYLNFIHGSAEQVGLPKGSFDLVTLYTCLSSILDDSIRRTVCREAMAMLKPGGWVLIYDFRVNNPFNRDVKKVTLRELRSYFVDCPCRSKTLTLWPHLTRYVSPAGIILADLLECLPFLRTHRMTMFMKPDKQ